MRRFIENCVCAILIGLLVAFACAIPVGIVYTIIHFIMKWW
jgi:hypothetical protein